MELSEVEPDAVKEDPEGGAAADENGLPPPVVVLWGSCVSLLSLLLEKLWFTGG